MQDSILTTVVKDIDGEVTTLEKYAVDCQCRLKVWLNAAI